MIQRVRQPHRLIAVVVMQILRLLLLQQVVVAVVDQAEALVVNLKIQVLGRVRKSQNLESVDYLVI